MWSLGCGLGGNSGFRVWDLGLVHEVLGSYLTPAIPGFIPQHVDQHVQHVSLYMPRAR